MSDFKTWRVGHLLHEYINYTTNEKFVRVGYENGKKEKICEGTCHKRERKRAQNVCDAKVLLVSQKSRWQQHINGRCSSSSPYVGHASSFNDLSSGLRDSNP